MPDPLTREPIQIVANTTVAWRRELAEFDPADGWTLAYSFEGPAELEKAATVDGDGFLVELTEADTALAAGSYRWQAFASRVGPPTERVAVLAGVLEVVQDLAAATGVGEELEHAEKMVAAIEATLEGRATKDQSRYAIAGRQIDRIPFPELREALRDYRVEVAAIRAARRQGAEPRRRRRIRTRFRGA